MAFGRGRDTDELAAQVRERVLALARAVDHASADPPGGPGNDPESGPGTDPAGGTAWGGWVPQRPAVPGPGAGAQTGDGAQPGGSAPASARVGAQTGDGAQARVGAQRGRRARPGRAARMRAGVADRLPPRMRAPGGRLDRLSVDRGQVAVLAVVGLVGLVLAVLYVVAGRADELSIPLASGSARSAEGGREAAATASPAQPPGDGSSALDEASDRPLSDTAGALPSPGAIPSPGPSGVVVHVTGLVHRPGLVRLPAGSRVDDALRAAGGVLDGVDVFALNLARTLVDGEQVAVGVTPAPDASAGAGTTGSAPGGAGGGGSGPVNLNTATLADLDSLTGVGPVLAQRILDWRDANGRFTSVEELQEISGIGPATFAELAPQVIV